MKVISNGEITDKVWKEIYCQAYDNSVPFKLKIQVPYKVLARLEWDCVDYDNGKAIYYIDIYV